MSTVTKAKINLKDGTIELEGSEAFVSKQLEDFKKEYQVYKSDKPSPSMTTQKVVPEPNKAERKRKKKGSGAVQLVAPIPIDLKANKNGKPNLRDFYKEKKPRTFMEKLTVFAYYLDKYLNIKEMLPGHVVACCREASTKIPTDIPMAFYNTQNLHGWVIKAEKTGDAVNITTAGVNLVEHDLPRLQNVTAAKTAT